MPKYSFLCKDCDKNFILFITINDLESGNINCEECRSKSVKRLYNFTGMNKALSHEERIEEIEKEVKDTIKKVKEGSIRHIKDIYGYE